MEIPYILQYAKESWLDEHIEPNLQFTKFDLWTIYTLDYQWTQLTMKKDALLHALDGLLRAEKEDEKNSGDDEDDEDGDNDLDGESHDNAEKVKEDKKKQKQESREKSDKVHQERRIEVESLKAQIVEIRDPLVLDDYQDLFVFQYGSEARKKYKQIARRDFVQLAQQNGIPEFAFTFAPPVKTVSSAMLIPSTYEVHRFGPLSPLEAAAPYVSVDGFSSSEEVITASVKYLARVYSVDPQVRLTMENILTIYATISTTPTSTGASSGRFTGSARTNLKLSH